MKKKSFNSDELMEIITDVARFAKVVDETKLTAIRAAAKDYIIRNFPEMEEEPEEKPKKTRHEKEWFAVRPKGVVSSCYIFQKKGTTKTLEGTDLDFEVDWNHTPENIVARIEAFIRDEKENGKRSGSLDSVGDFMEHGNKKRMKAYGLDLKTKLPAVFLPDAMISIHV